MAVRRSIASKTRQRRAAPQSGASAAAPQIPSWINAEVFIFDVEGTLVDAAMPTLRCWRETLQAFGYDIGLAEVHRFTGMDGSEMLAQLLPASREVERKEILERQGARFREEYLPHIAAFSNVRALFEALKQCGRRIALATDCQKDELRHYLAVAHIADLTDAIACGSDVRRGKPDSGLVELALRRARAGRRLSVMVGDTPYDATAARRAGILTIGVLTGHFSAQELLNAGCQAVLRDVGALRDALVGGPETVTIPAAQEPASRATRRKKLRPTVGDGRPRASPVWGRGGVGT